MSPYLFALVMEIFSGSMMKVTANTTFGFHWRCKKTRLSHLCFADDFLIFFKCNIGSVSLINGCLNHFGSLSGLVPNLGKSQIFFCGLNDAIREQIFSTLGFPVRELPIQYLGVPIISTRLRSIDCNRFFVTELWQVRRVGITNFFLMPRSATTGTINSICYPILLVINICASKRHCSTN